ncbi:MAG: hypothetical protein M5R42_05500 [Rhodocyclaceae bacterium]|nr:hypothetical protein [Rhodocyclaceae bacterium]
MKPAVDYVRTSSAKCARPVLRQRARSPRLLVRPSEADPRLAARNRRLRAADAGKTRRCGDWVEGEKRYKQLGVHAGVSADLRCCTCRSSRPVAALEDPAAPPWALAPSGARLIQSQLAGENCPA